MTRHLEVGRHLNFFGMILSLRVPLSQNVEEGYLLSTLHCDSEACAKR